MGSKVAFCLDKSGSEESLTGPESVFRLYVAVIRWLSLDSCIWAMLEFLLACSRNEFRLIICSGKRIGYSNTEIFSCEENIDNTEHYIRFLLLRTFEFHV